MTANSGQVVGDDLSGQRPITLVIPCKAEYVGLCRLVAGVLGARESLDDEVIADLKLVVTEACTCFVWGPDSSSAAGRQTPVCGSACSLQIDFNVMPEVWEIVISDPDRRRRVPLPERCDPMSEGGLGLSIIKALVDTFEQTDSDEEGSTLRLVKRLPSPPEALL
ncbi:MAG: ATP-binding protein [Thermoleophilia bacterium]|nr:ATP-binding protein [Thermoleophilia bacterium]